MDDPNKSQLDSILSFVAGKNNPSEKSLRERGSRIHYDIIVEASSWLLMATDLLPISMPLGNPEFEMPESTYNSNQFNL